jgi:hypothetical protein
LRDDDSLETQWAFHHRIAPPRLALDLLVANWTNKLELAHAIGDSIPHPRATGNGVFKNFFMRLCD